MSEKSFLWTTGGAGDGASTYTRADWLRIAKVFAGCHGYEGVAPSLLNALACTGSANNVAVATGGAVVDGKPYYNDAVVNVAIPSAVGGGNTRIDRVVLRADWTAQTVRVTRIAGTDAGSPVAPAITQTSETTYDIMLCQALVNTSGDVVVTDERVFGRISKTDAAPGALAADATGRALMAAALFDAATVAAKFGTDSFTAAVLLQLIQDGAFAADAATRALFADAIWTTAKLAANAVDDTKLRQGTALTVIGRSANSTGNVADIAAASDGEVLRRSGTSLGFGKVATGGLADDSVTYAIAGTAVAKILKRQGGNATHWGNVSGAGYGGANNYDPGAVKVELGYKEWSGAGASDGTITVTFNSAFSATPIVLASLAYYATLSNAQAAVTVYAYAGIAANTTTVDLIWHVSHGATIAGIGIAWLAMGPE